MGYVKEFLAKDYCGQCGFELLDDEESYCSGFCEGMGKHDMDEHQDCDYKVEPRPLTIS